MALEEVFVSYSREDNEKVLALTAKLRAAGVPLWMDVRSIDGAAMWGEEIVNALDKAKVLLLMVSESAVHSHNVTKEVLLASERKGHILPVDLEPTVIPPGLKYPLAGIHHIEYYHGNADEHLQAIPRSLERVGVTITKPRSEVAATAGAATPGATAPAQPGKGAEPAIESGALAVLPFDNISPDNDASYFSDGLTEELIARLSLVDEIELGSRWPACLSTA